MDKIRVINVSESTIFPRKYVLPEVVCNFPVKRNKFQYIPQIQEWIQWVFQFSSIKYKEFTKILETEEYVYHFYPLCTDVQRFEILIKFFAHFFVIDDHTEYNFGDIARNPEQSIKIWTQFGEIFDKLEGKDSMKIWKWKPYIFSMYACLEPIYRSFNNFQKRRFNKEWRFYVQGKIEEMNFIAQNNRHTSVDQLNKLKLKSGAVRVVIQVIEFADQIVVPEHVWEDPKLEKILELASIHMNHTNDIYSFEKEFNETNDLNKMFNMAALFCAVEGISPEESMERVAKNLLNIEKEIIQLENEFLNEPDCLSITNALIDRINICIGSNYLCSTFLDRFNKLQ